jgi:ATP10 protein
MARGQTHHALWVIALLCASIPVVGQDSMRVPATHGTTLTGRLIALPDTLKGHVNILVLGFSHASQEQVANWGRLIAADYGKSTEISYFELPILASVPRMVRNFVVKRMESSVPFDERDHYIPVLEGEPAWRAVAHYDKPDDAYVLLVDSKGLVLWQMEGEATNAAYSNFKQEVAKRLRAVAAQ